MKPRNVANVRGARLFAAALLIVGGGVVGAVLALSRSHKHTTSAHTTQRAARPQNAQPQAHVRKVRTARAESAQLTRWRSVGYWAHAVRPATVHVAPLRRSAPVTRLHFETEDGFPEVYLVLRRVVTPSGRTWLKIALPLRPNGTTGWVLRGALGQLRSVTTWLVVDRRALRVSFFDRGRRLWNAPVGIGKSATPTPTGLFWVREEFVLPNQAFYGPYAFGTSAYASVSDWPGGGVVGLHGTSLPQLIPGRPSHGCIRLRNQDILWLAQHVPVGTPISILN